jgi:hypothetical protein
MTDDLRRRAVAHGDRRLCTAALGCYGELAGGVIAREVLLADAANLSV